MVGGGNTAVEEALYLANIASHVTLVHRRDKLRSEKILQDRLFALESAGKVTILWNHAVDEILGDETGVTGVRVRATVGGSAARRSRSTACSLPWDISPTHSCSRNSSTCAAATSSSRADSMAMPPRPASPACSPQATSPITSIVRPSPRRARAAWRRSMPTVILERMESAARRRRPRCQRVTPLRARFLAQHRRHRCRGLECACRRTPTLPAARVPGGARAVGLRGAADRLDAPPFGARGCARPCRRGDAALPEEPLPWRIRLRFFLGQRLCPAWAATIIRSC